MLRERTDRAWFSHLLRHPDRKWSGSIPFNPQSAWGHFSDSADFHRKCHGNKIVNQDSSYTLALASQPKHKTEAPWPCHCLVHRFFIILFNSLKGSTAVTCGRKATSTSVEIH